MPNFSYKALGRDGKEKYDLFSVSIEPSKNGTASTDKDAINGAIIKLYVGKQ